MSIDETSEVRYAVVDDAIAVVTLARPHRANAQTRKLLYDLDEALHRAAADDAVKVIVLEGEGDHFSSGHDLRDDTMLDLSGPRVGMWGGFTAQAAEQICGIEQEFFLGLSLRWRNIPKPTIAAVHGKVIAGGLMLAWPCDLIVAAEGTEFSDPVVALNMSGVEYFAHVWELGSARRAKEMLFLGEPIGAEEALALGMVNRVVPADELREATLALARRIADQPMFGLKMAKQAVNQSVDAQGFQTALQAGFWVHQLGHAHNLAVHGIPIDPQGPERLRARVRGDATD